MVKFYGKPVYKGIAVGPVVVLKNEDQKVKRRKVDSPEKEVAKV